jgi:GH18 family chitinase
VTGHNAPLYAHDFDKDKTLNVDYAVKLWLQHVPPHKLIVGLGTYGRGFKLREGFESCPLTGTPSMGPSRSGVYSREKGFLGKQYCIAWRFCLELSCVYLDALFAAIYKWINCGFVSSLL